MVKDGERFCDVCYRSIGKRERHIRRKISKEDVPLIALGDLLTVDAHGDVRMDICLDCASITGVAGEVTDGEL